MAGEREKLMRLKREKPAEWESMDDSERVTTVLDCACRNSGVGRLVYRDEELRQWNGIRH